MSPKQNLCRHVVFSQNCCFVANSVAKRPVNDSISTTYPLPLPKSIIGHVMSFYIKHAYEICYQMAGL